MNVNSLITSAITDQITSSVSRKLNIPQGKTKDAIDLAIPLLLGGLAKNASDPEEAKSISKALTKDHDGSILDRIPAIVNNTSVQREGAKILTHVLGKKQDAASQVIGNQVNLNPDQIQQILSVVAPVVLGALGKQHAKTNLSSQGLSALLQTITKQGAHSSSPNSGLISQILDQNKDGSIIDDVIKIGANIFGNLISKK